jgi:hypothetical protein
MKRNLLSKTSIFLSFLNVLIVININHEIAQRYLSADGKTQALFGITELLSFSYKYYFLIISLISIVLLIFSLRKREDKLIIGFAFGLSLFSILPIVVRIWKLMI